MAQIITSSNFDELLASGQPLLVDFFADWCGPCKAIAPTIEELATAYEGKAIVGKCNVDNDGDIAAQFGIRNIPTLLFFKGGQLVDKHVGMASKADLEAKLQALL
ncbi:MAG: thioredoxin [Bacteroidales bacterium]|nr:thioredoxin [Bacteroidales bacterium]